MKRLLPWILAGIFFTVGITTLNDYGMNWDEPTRLLRGQAFVEYYLTGKLIQLPQKLSPQLIAPGEFVTRYDYLAEEGQNRAVLPDSPKPQKAWADMVASLGRRVSYYQDAAWSKYFMRYDPVEAGHLPLPEILGSISNRIFYQALGIAGDIESYHIPYILLASVAVFVVTVFVMDVTGAWVPGLIAGLSMGLFPIFVAESHFNMKDPAVAAFFAGSIWMFWRWVGGKKIGNFVGFVLFVVLSLAVKWNIVFLPFILVPWLFSIRKTPEFRQWFNLKKLLLLLCAAGLACIAFLLLIWPVSWGQPLRALTDVVLYYVNTGYSGDFIQPAGFVRLGFNTYPVLLFLSQTPEIVFLLGSIGVWAVLTRRSAKHLNTGMLIFLWFLIPIIRYGLPKIHAYGGWRQIMEIAPALAMLAGFGSDVLLRSTSGLLRKAIVLIIMIPFILLITILIRIHPNENAFFNSFVGGLPGASVRNLIDPFLTYGNVYKQGAAWLNANAEKDAQVAILDGRTFAMSPVYLRQDISVSPYHFSDFNRKGEYIVVTDINTSHTTAEFSYWYMKTFLNPVHVIRLDGVPLLTIYKNDSVHARVKMDAEKGWPFTKAKYLTPTGEYLTLDFGKEVLVTKIVLSNPPVSCSYNQPYSAFDEVMQFLPSPVPADFDISGHSYVLTEKRYVNGTVEYLFAGEPANTVKIFVRSKESCFNGGTVTAVYGLPPYGFLTK